MPDTRTWQGEPGFRERVGDSLGRQSVMTTLGVEAVRVEPGEVELAMAYHAGFCQQNGFLHAGTVTTVLDSACGYAAYTLMPSPSEVLTVELKMNFLAPARGTRFRFVGHVVKAGRTLSNVRGEAYGMSPDGEQQLIATMDGTMMRLTPRAA